MAAVAVVQQDENLVMIGLILWTQKTKRYVQEESCPVPSLHIGIVVLEAVLENEPARNSNLKDVHTFGILSG